ncbi:D-erythronate dehydrogenase-like [Nymphalis io]|uniref:D-erythronate dehydrogenase-like n=1 Tax=Inachis io TaxID=171585 RepID=UPI002169D910|nr:D-erythronate dehydrogenase-like [Nymphalis io]XP_050342674.1 D-erythronate dehydrogenase-like [Nymphalis io]
MNVVITGAAGFLGSRLANALLAEHSKIPIARLVLIDLKQPHPYSDPRVTTLSVNLADPSAADLIIEPDCHVLFHLAAVLSGQAEVDLDLGLRVNVDATRALIEAARRRAPNLRFIFTSTIGVFGGTLPLVIDDQTVVTPENSYGSQKAMCELLLNDYARRGYVDSRIVRLPTVSVRAGTPNEAVTSFASGIIREPLNGKMSICPVRRTQKLWLSSPHTVVQNIIHAATIPAGELGSWRVVNLPGICVSVGEMIEALWEVAGDRAASLVHFDRDEMIERIVASFPSQCDNSRALRLGFAVDKSFIDFIRYYIRDDLNPSK